MMDGFDRFEINMNCLNLIRVKTLLYDKVVDEQ